MIPIEFEGANINLHGNVPAPALMGLDAGNVPYVLIAWQPSVEDLAAINAGRPIWLKINTLAVLTTTIFTSDENGNANV